MKEGYLQLKIAELNDKCKKIEEMLSLEESTLKLLHERIGDSKVLLKKLKNLEDFKNQITSQVIEENKKIREKHIEDLSKEFSEIVEQTLERKGEDINKTLNYLKERESEIKQLGETIAIQTKEIGYLLEFNNLLMMKLVNKAVLSDQEVNEMNRRASKKAENK